MSDEEKKAIERTQEHLTEMLKKYEMYNDQLDVQSHYRNGDIKIILNLIEKQQKELDNIKEIEKSHKEENGKLREEIIRLDNVLKAKKQEIAYLKIQIPSDRIFYFSDKDYISKDKIKELLENEIIDISGFRCIAVEDIENLLEDK